MILIKLCIIYLSERGKNRPHSRINTLNYSRRWGTCSISVLQHGGVNGLPRICRRYVLRRRSLTISHFPLVLLARAFTGCKKMMKKNGSPGQIQIIAVLHEVRWKLALGIEGSAQGNCYTPSARPRPPYQAFILSIPAVSLSGYSQAKLV